MGSSCSPAKQDSKRNARRISWDDAELVAIGVARGLSEKHAVERLNHFTYSAWVNWKARQARTAKVEDLFSRMKASRMSNLVGEIEKAATGSSGVRHDWRAAQMLASLHDQRFSNKQIETQNVTQTAVVIAAGGEGALRKMIEQYMGYAGNMHNGSNPVQIEVHPSAPDNALPAPEPANNPLSPQQIAARARWDRVRAEKAAAKDCATPIPSKSDP